MEKEISKREPKIRSVYYKEWRPFIDGIVETVQYGW